ncbi:MAG: CcoQ/FixQ family Cbb3-type cytochrome c oxidase assembly chaperone [Thermoanaerobaculia bacterium]
MYREFYAALDSPLLPLVAMLFFAVAFGLVLLRVYGRARRSDFDAVAALPLDPRDSLEAREVKP